MKWKQYGTGMMMAAWAVAGGAEAAEVLQDDFSYPDGPVVGVFGSAWTAHSQLGNGPALATNGWLRLSESGAEDISRALDGGPYPAAGSAITLYAGFTLRVESLPSAGGAYISHYRNNTTSHRGRLWIYQAPEEESQFRLSIGNSAGAGITSGPWPDAFSPGTEYRIVIRYEIATGQTAFWVDPASDADPLVVANDAPAPAEIVHFSFRQSPDMGEIWIDDLKVGTAFGDVAEPGVKLLLRRGQAGLELLWPEVAFDYELQQSPSLEPGSWTGVDGIVFTEGGFFRLDLPGTGGPLFYRLRK